MCFVAVSMEVLEKEHQSQALKGDVGRFVDAGPTLPDMYQPVGKLKVDYEIDELNAKLIDLKQRFKV